MNEQQQYGVLVNETVIQSCWGASWWLLQRRQWEASGRLRIVTPGMIGDTIELGPLARDDAEFAAAHMHEAGGIPASAVRVRPWRSLTGGEDRG